MIHNNRAYIYIRTIRNKDISYRVYLRIVFGSQKKEYALGIQISDPSKFDEKKNIIKGGSEVAKYNLIIAQTLHRANEIMNDADIQGIKLTAFQFDQLFCKKGNPESFIEFALEEIKQLNSVQSDGYVTHLKTEITKLQSYKKEVTFSDLTYDFLCKYERYMYTALKNKVNTVDSSMKRIKTLINIAVKKDKIHKSPFDIYKIKTEEANRTSLTLDEVKKLNELYDKQILPDYLQNVLRYFIFSCYCGLRYSDVKELEYSDLQFNQGEYFIDVEQGKTGNMVAVPLKSRALQLIGPIENKQGPIFRVITGQVTNRFLIEIMKAALINKHITFHCSRHSFATIALNIGIELVVVSSLLGHTDIKTTQIYAKVLMSSKSAAMDKFDKI